MDYSKHSILASRFATLALVFSVSACMLSRSMVEEEKLGNKQPATEKTAKEQKPVKAETPKVETPKAASQKATKPAVSKVEVKKNEPAKKNLKQADAKVVDQARQPAPKAKEDSNKKVVRFVNVETLNVRMHASMDAPVVGKLTLGTMYHVKVEGDWAKIGENQYVMTRFLTNQQPRRNGSTWSMRK